VRLRLESETETNGVASHLRLPLATESDDYIKKPIDPARFVARVRAVLRRMGG
jgi:DNA-binding response OmpR family regulator